MFHLYDLISLFFIITFVCMLDMLKTCFNTFILCKFVHLFPILHFFTLWKHKKTRTLFQYFHVVQKPRNKWVKSKWNVCNDHCQRRKLLISWAKNRDPHWYYLFSTYHFKYRKMIKNFLSLILDYRIHKVLKKLTFRSKTFHQYFFLSALFLPQERQISMVKKHTTFFFNSMLKLKKTW